MVAPSRSPSHPRRHRSRAERTQGHEDRGEEWAHASGETEGDGFSVSCGGPIDASEPPGDARFAELDAFAGNFGSGMGILPMGWKPITESGVIYGLNLPQEPELLGACRTLNWHYHIVGSRHARTICLRRP